MSNTSETFLEYKSRVIDSKSASFCGAKWYNATIWLGNGTTASCHHPPAHKIPLEEVATSYKAIHNTQYKKLVRKQMLEGERPKECEYCWKIEDMGKDKVSDRVYKSVIYTDEELKEAKTELGWQQDVDLKTLEIAFDPNCNFACSYCNSSFSTTWQNDIKKSGPYQNLVSDGAGAFQHCYSLHHINIPGGVTSIQRFAFAYCRGLTTLVLNNGLRVIEYDAFTNCISLECIVVPPTVREIHEDAFSSCKKLSHVILQNGLEII